jgi:dTDP-4-amino-4,6-dideoxygalactose transaminase
MISRTKANYSIKDLIKAAIISEKGDKHKKRLTMLLQKYFNGRNVLLTPSGRCGLLAVLLSIRQKRVIVPAYTCPAVVEAIQLVGKEVVYVDIEKNGFNMDLDDLNETVDADSVVVATHQFGFPFDIERCVELCRSKGAFVLEDAAAAFGTRIDGRLVGTFGDAAFFSFDSTKLVNVPMKGGFVLVKSDHLFNQIRNVYNREVERMPMQIKIRLLLMAFMLLLLENGLFYRIFHKTYFQMRGKFTAESTNLHTRRTIFYRYDLTNWQAYIAAKQIEIIENIIAKRQALYAEYHRKLTKLNMINLPPFDERRQWACIRFPIQVKGKKLDYYRAAVKKGVDFAFSFTFITAPSNFCHAHKLADSVLDIPYYWKLRHTELQQIVRVLETIEKESEQ